MLEFAGAPYRTPTNVFVHGFLTALGEKMSKSRGTGISPDYYLDLGLNSEWLRYYIAAKLNEKVEDIDFNPDDFIARVNSDLIGKYVNIAARAARFVAGAGNQLGQGQPFAARHNGMTPGQVADLVGAHYERREFAKALREIMVIADQTNQYFDTAKPWELAKDPAKAQSAVAVSSECLEDFRILTVLLKPVLPALAAQAEALSQAHAASVGRHRATFARWAPHRQLCAPHVPNRPQADRRADRRPRAGIGGAAGRPPRLPLRLNRHRRAARSPSTTSPRSTCASRESSMPSTSPAPTSCSS